MTRARSRARELALQCLYQYELRGEEAREATLRLLQDAEAEVRGYAVTLVEGVRAHDAGLAAALRPLVEHWTWERVAVLDRAVLKLAAFEMTHAAEVPPKVVMDEAIELAKRFSTRDSGAFVNGILDRLYQDRLRAAAGPC